MVLASISNSEINQFLTDFYSEISKIMFIETYFCLRRANDTELEGEDLSVPSFFKFIDETESSDIDSDFAQINAVFSWRRNPYQPSFENRNEACVDIFFPGRHWSQPCHFLDPFLCQRSTTTLVLRLIFQY